MHASIPYGEVWWDLAVMDGGDWNTASTVAEATTPLGQTLDFGHTDLVEESYHGTHDWVIRTVVTTLLSHHTESIQRISINLRRHA